MNAIVSSFRGVFNIVEQMKEPVSVYIKGKLVKGERGEIDTLIRWGCRTPMKAKQYINLSKNIGHISDKITAREILKVPMTKEYIEGDFDTIIGRPRFHRGGRNFHVCTTAEEYEEVRELCDYFTHFYPKTREFRAHVAHGKILVLLEKAPCEGIAWNHTLNEEAWTVIPWNDYDTEICKLALQAADEIEVDFCAVDILAYPEDKRLHKQVVCELNSSPAVEGYTAERYAKYFDWLLKGEREHFNWKNWTEAKSFAFKNKQLCAG